MFTAKRIFECVRPQDWFAAIDLKDAYFHVSILPRRSSLSRPGLRTQGPSAPAPSSSGPSGQMGEEQTLPRAEDLFSRYGNRLGRHVRAAYES